MLSNKNMIVYLSLLFLPLSKGFSNEKETEMLEKSFYFYQQAPEQVEKMTALFELGKAYAYKEKKIPEAIQKEMDLIIQQNMFFLSRILDARAEMQCMTDINEAVKSGMTIPDFMMRLHANCRTIARFCEKGDKTNAQALFDEASASVELHDFSSSKPTPEEKDWMRKLLIEAQCHLDPKTALKAVSKIQNKDIKIQTLTKMGKILSKKNIQRGRHCFNLAKAMSEEFEDEMMKKRLYHEILENQIQVDRKEALKNLDFLRNNTSKLPLRQKIESILLLSHFMKELTIQEIEQLIDQLKILCDESKNEDEKSVYPYLKAKFLAHKGEIEASIKELKKTPREVWPKFFGEIAQFVGETNITNAEKFLDLLEDKDKALILANIIKEKYSDKVE